MFKSWKSYRVFRSATRYGNRYIHDEEVKAFLDTVLATSKELETSIHVGCILWRAQLGNDWRSMHEEGEELIPFSPKRMKPLPFSATEGRANPKGIPYLYLATDKETAMSEVRPWVGAQISVGQFKIKKELRIIDCSVLHKNSLVIYDKEPDAEKRKTSVWRDITRAFSEPIDPSDQTADYLPTQIIAELFKSDGYDGIAYKSALSMGHNVVLFDLEIADLINCQLYEAGSIKFKFYQSGDPYDVKSTSDQKNI